MWRLPSTDGWQAFEITPLGLNHSGRALYACVRSEGMGWEPELLNESDDYKLTQRNVVELSKELIGLKELRVLLGYLDQWQPNAAPFRVELSPVPSPSLSFSLGHDAGLVRESGHPVMVAEYSSARFSFSWTARVDQSCLRAFAECIRCWLEGNH